MAAYLNPENVDSFNFENLRELKQLVPDETQRYTLIGLSLRLGDYRARKELPEEFFDKRKQITTRIKLAAYISQQQKEVRSQIVSKSPQEVIDSLKETPLEDNIRESEISKMLKRSDLLTLGKRVEIKFSNSNSRLYHDYRRDPSNLALNNIFLEEAKTIIHSLAYEARR